jgi:hypothetical protein
MHSWFKSRCELASSLAEGLVHRRKTILVTIIVLGSTAPNRIPGDSRCRLTNRQGKW